MRSSALNQALNWGRVFFGRGSAINPCRVVNKGSWCMWTPDKDVLHCSCCWLKHCVAAPIHKTPIRLFHPSPSGDWKTFLSRSSPLYAQRILSFFTPSRISPMLFHPRWFAGNPPGCCLTYPSCSLFWLMFPHKRQLPLYPPKVIPKNLAAIHGLVTELLIPKIRNYFSWFIISSCSNPPPL